MFYKCLIQYCIGFKSHVEGYCLPAKVGSKKEQLCAIEPSAKLCTVLEVGEELIPIIITILWLWFHDDMHASSWLIVPIIQKFHLGYTLFSGRDFIQFG